MNAAPEAPSTHLSRGRVEATVDAAVEATTDAGLGWITLESGVLVVGLTGSIPRRDTSKLESRLRDALPGIDAVTVLDRPTPSGIWLLPDVFRIAG